MMQEVNNKAIARRFLEAVGRGWPAPGGDLITATALDAIVRVLAPFADVRLAIDSSLAEGDVVVCQARLSGRHVAPFLGLPPSGRVIEAAMALGFRMDAGRIVDSWVNWDERALIRPPRLSEEPPEPVLDVDEIQGNVLPGFSKDHQTLLLLNIVDPAAAGRWLGRLVPHIATLREVHDFKRLFEQTRQRRGAEGSVHSLWVNIAFSAAGLSKLGIDPVDIADAAFREGMSRRAALLGDPVDPRMPGHVSHWRFGGAEPVPDILLLIAGDDAGCVARETARLLAEARPGVQVAFEQRGAVLPPPLRNHEPFGYADGISQPRLRGRLSERVDDFFTPRTPDGEVAPSLRGTGLVWPGEFVFGYPEEGPHGTPGPASVGGPPWMRNGSFLVLRCYRQDVERFGSFLQDSTARLSRQYPELRDLTARRLGAFMFGRWQSGAPLELCPDSDDPLLGEDEMRNNQFSFSPSAKPCPYAAHIRRANPRNDPGATGEAQRHRMLRRGIPYSDGTERGLLFIAYMTSIERQFEFLFRHWFNNPDFGNKNAGVDPIFGAAATGRPFMVPVDGRGAGPVLTLPVWATSIGGGYFFAPSISALAQLAGR
jgi:Dyp-type peroxidase family